MPSSAPCQPVRLMLVDTRREPRRGRAHDRVDRRIAQQVELPQCLEIHRIELGRLMDEMLSSQKRRAPERGPIEHREKEKLGDQIRRAIAQRLERRQ